MPKRYWKQTGKKLSFCFSKSRLDQNISALRSYNDDLKKLSSDTRPQIFSKSHTLYNQSHDCRNAIRRYRTIRDASQQVYEALGKACNKHSEHLAHFCVEVEQVILDGERAPQVKFSLGFTHITIAGLTRLSEPIWFVLDSSIGPQNTAIPSSHLTNLQQLGSTLKRQLDHAVEPSTRKAKKRVRFQTPVPERCPDQHLTIAPDAFLSENCMKRDFCDDLRRCFRQPRKADICVGILESTDECKHFVYPSSLTSCSHPYKAISLAQLIKTAAPANRIGSIPIHERLSLAKKLAVAVLQYHTTSWLKVSWRSDDIILFGVKRSTQIADVPSLSAPHLNARVTSPSQQPSQSPEFPSRTLARNPTLFSLGVVLLEIGHAASLKTLRQPCDLTHGREDNYTDFFTARRLAKSKRSTMGLKYDSIVEQLVECVFPDGDDLHSERLQAAFHEDIVCSLGGIEEGFRKLHLTG